MNLFDFKIIKQNPFTLNTKNATCRRRFKNYVLRQDLLAEDHGGMNALERNWPYGIVANYLIAKLEIGYLKPELASKPL